MPLIARLGPNHLPPMPPRRVTLVDGQKAANLMMVNPIVVGNSFASGSKVVLQGIALLLLLLLTTWVYWPGLTGPLVLDDYWNLNPLGAGGGITDLQGLLTFVFGNTSGPTGRPVSMLSFLIGAQSWPPFVRSFKYTNIMIHLLCGVVLLWFCIQLFQQYSGRPKNYSWLALVVPMNDLIFRFCLTHLKHNSTCHLAL